MKIYMFLHFLRVQVDQVQELMEARINTTWFGHSATYFAKVHAIIVYGGGDEKGPFESEHSLWVLKLGQAGLTRFDYENMASKKNQEQKQPQGMNEKGEGKDEQLSETKVKNYGGKEDNNLIGKIKRTDMKWEKVKLQDTTRDIRRIGHATAKYTSYIYIFGGFANAQYLSTVSRINIGGYDTNTGDPLWKHPVAWETCHPYRQPYEILKTNMMSPRVGHTVSTFDKSMYIWGGVANFELSSNHVYEFNAESFEWRRLEHVGSAPRMRYGHVATEIEGSQHLIIISGGVTIQNEDGDGGYGNPISTAKRETILSDFWTFNITHKIWMQIQLSGLSYQNYQHEMVSFGRNKSEIFVFGGTKSKTVDNDSGQITYQYSGIGLNTDPEWRKLNVV